MKNFGIFTAGSIFGITVGAACGLIGGLALALVVVEEQEEKAMERARKYFSAREGTTTV